MAFFMVALGGAHVLLRVQRAFTALGFPAGALDIYPASLKLNPVK